MAQLFAPKRLLHCGSKSGHSSFRTPVSGVADFIKMEFTASTAYVAEIRLAGLVVLWDVIEVCTVLWFFCASGRYKHIHRYLLHLLTMKIRNLWHIIMLLSSFPPPFLWISMCRYNLPLSPPPPLSEAEWHHDFHHNQHQHPTTMNDVADYPNTLKKGTNDSPCCDASRVPGMFFFICSFFFYFYFYLILLITIYT